MGFYLSGACEMGSIFSYDYFDFLSILIFYICSMYSGWSFIMYIHSIYLLIMWIVGMKQYFSSDFNFLPSNYKLLDYFSFFPLHRCVFLFCKAPIPVGGAPMWKEFYSVLKELFSESSSMPREFSIFTVKHNEIFFAMKK